MRISLILGVTVTVYICSRAWAQEVAVLPNTEEVQPERREPISPMTKILGWGIDHSEAGALREKANAIREGREQPLAIDRDVLDALFPNPLEMMKRDVDALRSGTLDVVGVVHHLRKLEDMVQDIDNANDFYKIDGVNTVVNFLQDFDAEVVATAAWVLGTLVQSNDKPQAQVLQAGALPVLLNIIGQPSSRVPDATKAKCLYALSALIRTNPAGLQLWIENGGIRHVVDVILDETNGLVVRRKAATLAGDLVIDRPTLAAQMGELGVCEGMLGMLKGDDADVHDHVLEALNTLLVHSPDNVGRVVNGGGKSILQFFHGHVKQVADLAEPGRYDHIFARVEETSKLIDEWEKSRGLK